jgi:hypothetical protein
MSVVTLLSQRGLYLTWQREVAARARWQPPHRPQQRPTEGAPAAAELKRTRAAIRAAGPGLLP